MQRRNLQMQTYTQGDLQVRSAVPIADIQKFDMKVDRNDHAVCQVEGTVPEKYADVFWIITLYIKSP